MTQRPESRYGKRRTAGRSRRRTVIVLSALGIVIAVAITAVVYQRIGNQDVSGSLAGYRVIDSETASVTISVTRKDPSRPVDCIVRIRSEDGDEAGRREVLVPPATAGTVQVTTVLKSSKPPKVADIYGCGTDIPGYLRPQ